jgi:hypothetical protein
VENRLLGLPVIRIGIESGFGGTSLGGLSISASPTKDGIAKPSARGIAGTRAPTKLTAATIAR